MSSDTKFGVKNFGAAVVVLGELGALEAWWRWTVLPSQQHDVVTMSWRVIC